MNELEKLLETSRPTIEVPTFQRTLRRELLYSAPARTSGLLGYAAAFAAGVVLTLGALALGLRAQGSGAHAVWTALAGTPVADQPPAAGAVATEEVPVIPSVDDRPTGAPRTLDTLGRSLNQDEILAAMLAEGAYNREADASFAGQWVGDRNPDGPRTLAPAGEEILTVREFRTQAGKRVRVYTSLQAGEHPRVY